MFWVSVLCEHRHKANLDGILVDKSDTSAFAKREVCWSNNSGGNISTAADETNKGLLLAKQELESMALESGWVKATKKQVENLEDVDAGWICPVCRKELSI